MSENKMNLANKITVLRIVSIPFFILAVIYKKMDIALVFFILAAISDAVDGFIARAMDQKTQLGTILDPVADKLLLLSAFICLSAVKTIPPEVRLPPFVPVVVISRDFIIILGSIIVYLTTGSIKIAPSVVGKITTFFQMLTIVSVLLLFKYSFVVWGITVVLTIVSGTDYVMKGSRSLSVNYNLPRGR